MIDKNSLQNEKPQKKIKFIIESDLENVALVGMAVNRICKSIPFTDTEAFQIELCVIEAVNNSIIHAYEMDKSFNVEVAFSLYTDRIVIDVIDMGNILDQNLLIRADISKFHKTDDLDNIPESGRGLAVIKEVMDSTIYKTIDNKNHLRMIKIRSNSDGDN